MRAWRFSAARPSQPPERLVERGHDILDRNLAEVDAEVLAHLAGVVARPLGGEARGHRDGVDAVRAERIRRDRRGERGVDAARDPEDDVPEAVLGDVVAQPETEREAHLLELRLERRNRRRRPGSSTATGCSEPERRRRRRRGQRSLELPAPHVAQPPADGLRRVDVDHQQRFLEPGRTGNHLSLVVEHDGVTVENELVLAADEVAERDVHRVVARARHEHLLAVLGLADVERRGGEVDEQGRARECEIGRRRPGLPDVLADGRPDEDLAELEQQQLAPAAK